MNVAIAGQCQHLSYTTNVGPTTDQRNHTCSVCGHFWTTFPERAAPAPSVFAAMNLPECDLRWCNEHGMTHSVELHAPDCVFDGEEDQAEAERPALVGGEAVDPIKDALMAALGYVKGETYGYLAHEDQCGPDEIIAELEAALSLPAAQDGDAEFREQAAYDREVLDSLERILRHNHWGITGRWDEIVAQLCDRLRAAEATPNAIRGDKGAEYDDEKPWRHDSLCGCGRPAEYYATIDGKPACNKHARCAAPTQAAAKDTP